MLYARTGPDGRPIQTLREHTFQVAKRAEDYLSAVDMRGCGYLAGLCHDEGKASRPWQDYLLSGGMKIPHAPQSRAFLESVCGLCGCSAPFIQFLAEAAGAHHTGLHDMLELSFGEEPDPACTEAFFEDCVSGEALAGLLPPAEEEFQRAIRRIGAEEQNGSEAGAESYLFQTGLLLRYLLSALVDADRLDAAESEGRFPPEPDRTGRDLWPLFLEKLEEKLASFPGDKPVDRLRAEISAACAEAGEGPKGVYRLHVPTGGGKTLSGLRFALRQCLAHGMDRIFYVIPYTTILDQTAAAFCEIFDGEGDVLVHDSNFLPDEDEARYYALAERWNAPVVLTTQVQFLNAFYLGKTGSARRMHMLANSVVLFDEVQTVPLKCLSLFHCAVRFLVKRCGCTAVLCTATQPPTEAPPGTRSSYPLPEPAQIVKNVDENFRAFRRTRIVDMSGGPPRSAENLADFVMGLGEKSVLTVLNTKRAVRNLYEALKSRPCEVYHLSTAMYPAHRGRVLAEIIEKLKDKDRETPLICVSTNLIEAGVDISFDCAVRSLAGLDSVAQTAGRCNRHGLFEQKNVYLIRSAEEDLRRLPDLVKARNCTARVLDEYRKDPAAFGGDLLGIKAVERYFTYYFGEERGIMNYPIPPLPDMTELLGRNVSMRREAARRGVPAAGALFGQSFQTAGERFRVIEEDAAAVLVRAPESHALIERLRARKDVKKDLRKAGLYSVGLFPYQIENLKKAGALDFDTLRDVGVTILDGSWYDGQTGVLTDGDAGKQIENYIIE